MSSQQPRIQKQGELFCAVSGVFYRAIDPQHRDAALAGSRSAGRYSPAGSPGLYLSSSPEGVEAAMIAHRDSRTPDLEIIEVEVLAEQIFDLRDSAARQAADIRLDDAVAPWKQIAAEGGRPPSWGVRHRLEALGAHGLIDPSRKRPGLWHLALFRWNGGSGPAAQVRD
ncbi:RES family NAD+ phosphorylase [Nesterenkonia ebinurensis]|uniref:RES family NAD+ phosphorylase n=1 Tax=Nesterenkonia ebinurensis TaxID=2608252 RepID=UPI001CC71781|nr:RES domain-containing protein [Nesterenkonia ebinurensis]